MVSRGSRPQRGSDGRDVSITPSLTTLLRPLPQQTIQRNPLKYTVKDIMPLDDPVLEDRRMYTPDKLRTPTAYTRRAIRIRAGYHPRSLNFRIPNLVALCLKRKMRKEVLHALKKAGKGGQKKRKLNFWSRIGC